MSVLKFYTKKCEPCKLLKDILDKSDIRYIPVEAVPHSILVIKYGIRTVPTLVHEKSGKKLVGLKSIIEVREWIKLCEQE